MAHGHGHHEEYAGAEAAGAMSWLVAMVVFLVLAVALVVALFVWAPWDDDNTSVNPGGNVPGVEEGDNSEGGGVNIEGNDVDVGDGGTDGGEGDSDGGQGQ